MSKSWIVVIVIAVAALWFLNYRQNKFLNELTQTKSQPQPIQKTPQPTLAPSHRSRPNSQNASAIPTEAPRTADITVAYDSPPDSGMSSGDGTASVSKIPRSLARLHQQVASFALQSFLREAGIESQTRFNLKDHTIREFGSDGLVLEGTLENNQELAFFVQRGSDTNKLLMSFLDENAADPKSIVKVKGRRPYYLLKTNESNLFIYLATTAKKITYLIAIRQQAPYTGEQTERTLSLMPQAQ